MREPIEVPKPAVIVLLTLDGIALAIWPLLVTWNVWHGGEFEDEAIEQRLMLTWTVWAVVVGALTFVFYCAKDVGKVVVR